MRPRLAYAIVGAMLLGTAAVLVVPRIAGGRGKPPAKPPTTAPQCSEHQIAEADCPWCRSAIVKERGECREHGVPEALCSRCNPALIPGFKAQGDWCAEHGLPESQCTQCNPDLAGTGTAEPSPSDAPPAAVTVVQDPDQPRSRRAPSLTCRTETLRVQFADPDTARKAGLEFERLVPQDVAITVTCTAELAYDGSRYACIRSPVAGVVSECARDLGAAVRAGDILAVVESAELGRARADFTKLADGLRVLEVRAEQARRLFQRLNDVEVRLTAVEYLEARALQEVAQRSLAMEQRLAEARATSGKDLMAAQVAQETAALRVQALRTRLELFGVPAATVAQLNWEQSRTLEGHGTTSEQEALEAEIERETARADLAAARGLLRSLGLPDSEIDAMASRREFSNALPLTAPWDGQVVARQAVVGEIAAPDDVLFEIADPSRLWAMLDVVEADMGSVKVGQPVVLEAAGCRGEPRAARISWVAPALDPRTRTLKARAEVPNPDGLLRAGTFAKALVTVSPQAPALLVPKSAVQWEGCCNVAFVRRSDVVFEPRKLRLGPATDRHYVVLDGLAEGDEVVTTGSFLLKTEILKGSIGAGCCEVEPGKR